MAAAMDNKAIALLLLLLLTDSAATTLGLHIFHEPFEYGGIPIPHTCMYVVSRISVFSHTKFQTWTYESRTYSTSHEWNTYGAVTRR